MSYLDLDNSSKKRGGAVSPNAQSLLPQELRNATTQIQSQLTKFQQNMRAIELSKNKIGSEEDNYEMRQAMLGKI